MLCVIIISGIISVDVFANLCISIGFTIKDKQLIVISKENPQINGKSVKTSDNYSNLVESIHVMS